MILTAPVAPAVKDNPAYKRPTFYIVQKFTDDKAGEIFPPPRVWIVLVHVSPQVSIQRPLGLLVSSLIEVARVGFPQENDLKCVDDSGFSSSILSGQKIDLIHFNELFGKIKPVNQQDLLQLLHFHPPFSVRIRWHSAFRWRPRTKPWEVWQIYSCPDYTSPRFSGSPNGYPTR